MRNFLGVGSRPFVLDQESWEWEQILGIVNAQLSGAEISFKTNNAFSHNIRVGLTMRWARDSFITPDWMSILRDDKMRPLFQEAIVTKLAVTQSTKVPNQSYG